MTPARLSPAVPFTTARGWCLLAMAAVLAAAGCSTAPPAAPLAASASMGTATGSVSPLPAFPLWSEGFAARWMRLSPERSTFGQYFSGAEQDALDGQLSPLTRERREAERALAAEGLAMLQQQLATALSPADRRAAKTMQWSLQRSLDAAPFEHLNFPFNQLGGLQVRSVNLLTQTHPMRRPSDVQSWLSRLAQLPQRFDEGIARTREAAARGVLPPRFILERGRAQVQALLVPHASDSVFVTSLAARTETMKGLDTLQRSEALQRAQTLVQAQLRPALQRTLALLDELHPQTTDDAGLWRLPGGEAAYAQALAAHTTTSMSADEIHQLGLREVGRIEAEMDRILRRLGRSEGTVRERMQALNRSLQPPAEPDPRPALLARYGAYVREAQQRAVPLFNLMPVAPVEVRRVPALTERTASAHYTTPTPDGSRPGIFWMPLPGPSFNIPGMKTLAIHEAVPGHHFQLALQQEQRDAPLWQRQRVFGGGSANAEGWALYAERLAIEQGWYEGDDVSLLGAWDGQLFRARRLVVDTGLHAKHWTRQQAIDYGISVSEVERYVANPGQACAYMVGQLRVLALRDEARAALGPRFSLPAFHDVVLRAGSVPLDVMSEVVRAWVKAQG
jgi:uncharacterized protein (DUF885 family)